MEEIWKDIKGYEGLYQVSNLGRVKSLARTIYKVDGTTQTFKDKIRSATFNGRGYLQVGLSKEGSYTTFKVHRLVANTFIPNPYNKTQVNHIDGNKDNNHRSNLEWCNHKYNMKHAKTVLNKSMGNKAKKLRNEAVKILHNKYTKDELSIIFETSYQNILRILNTDL